MSNYDRCRNNRTAAKEMKALLKNSLALATVFMVFLSGCDSPGDPEKVLARARKYYHLGNYEKSLQDYIWFHENALKYKPSLYGVRISFALLDWIELGKKYPKAHNALIDIRNRETEKIKNKQGTVELFHDVQSINKYLNESRRTVALYKTMTEIDFDLAKECYDIAKGDLIRHHEFELCNRMMPSPIFIVRDMRNMLKQNINIYKTNQWADNVHLEWTINFYLEEAEKTLIVLTKNNRFAEANRFLREAEADIDIARIKSGLEDIRNKYMNDQPTG